MVECEDGVVHEVREKPSLHLLINAGMYLLEPSVRDYIPAGQCFDMPQLLQLFRRASGAHLDITQECRLDSSRQPT